MPPPLHDPTYTHTLADGLLLRWSTAADLAGLAQLYGEVFRDSADGPPNRWIGNYSTDALSGRHPLIGPGDFAVVEDPAGGQLVAASCLLRATWTYAGIPFAVGRPELVATLPDFRNRGLIRAIFGLLHARSAALGHMAQGITGIPFYYRQFGYEYALDLHGERAIWLDAIPPHPAGATEGFSLRQMREADIPQLLRLYEREQATANGGAPSLVSAVLDERYLRWNHSGASEDYSGGYWSTLMILDAEGRGVGYALTRKRRSGDALRVVGLSVEAGVSLAVLMPALLRLLRAYAPTMPTFDDVEPPPTRLVFELGRNHPAYTAIGEGLAPGPPRPYGWYVRVPDLPAFLRLIAPELERRLAASVFVGYSGELRLNFYRDGLRLRFGEGRLREVEPWRSPLWGEPAHAGLPPLVFLQLLFGFRGLGELRNAFPDVRAGDDSAPLLEALFPHWPSRVVPQD